MLYENSNTLSVTAEKFVYLKRTKRIPVDIEVDFIMDDIRYAGTIENVSEEGLCIRSSSKKSDNHITPGGKLKVELALPSGEFLTLNCLVIWADKTNPKGFNHVLGLKVDEHNSDYDDFYKTLYISHVSII